MPELAEVAITAEILDANISGKQMTSFNIVSGRYLRKDPTGYWDFIANLPMTVDKVNSKGKFIWFELSSKGPNRQWYILQSFGLAGRWSLTEHSRSRFTMTFGKQKVYYVDDRNFGTIKFTPERSDLDVKLNKLAPDFLKTSNVDLKPIQSIDKPLVQILQDQNAIGSGIGNYLSAEILYRSRISPFRLGLDVTNAQLERLSFWIKYLTKLAYVNNSTNYMKKLGSDVNTIKKKRYHRSIRLEEPTFKFLVYRHKTDPKGRPIQADFMDKLKRTIYWVPSIQR